MTDTYIDLPEPTIINIEPPVPVYQLQPNKESCIILQVGEFSPSNISHVHITDVNTTKFNIILISCIYSSESLLKEYPRIPIIKAIVKSNNKLLFNAYINFLVLQDIRYDEDLKGLFMITLETVTKQVILKSYKEYTNTQDMITKLILLLHEGVVDDFIINI